MENSSGRYCDIMIWKLWALDILGILTDRPGQCNQRWNSKLGGADFPQKHVDDWTEKTDSPNPSESDTF